MEVFAAEVVEEEHWLVGEDDVGTALDEPSVACFLVGECKFVAVACIHFVPERV